MAKKPCEACAKGKMPSCSFLSSVSRAIKPFQIVHSDLKNMIKRSFNSYHYVLTILVIEQPFNNYFSFCTCLLLFGFVNDIIKGQQHESDFISFYLCLSLFGYLLSLISLSSYLWLISYWLISLG